MRHDARAYLSDIIESCGAIAAAVQGLDLDEYEGNRLIRSSVEREFIIIGEAIAALAQVAPDVFNAITKARRIVDFRNQLTHEYLTVDDAIVWAIVENDIPILFSECSSLIQRVTSRDEVL